MSTFSRLFNTPSIRRIGVAITWLPVAIFFNNHVAQLMWVKGPSMQPFLSPDYSCAGRKDIVLSIMHKPWENLQRGMVVAFWYAIFLVLERTGKLWFGVQYDV